MICRLRVAKGPNCTYFPLFVLVKNIYLFAAFFSFSLFLVYIYGVQYEVVYDMGSPYPDSFPSLWLC